ncbi:NAD(P)-binding protein [Cutaneotrichosporon oleaginosum]|uniref:NAD(P)-binding protein n=1 Tax=Cutaneotrichosporon oleaginosum TaxID=879819 RepID=A0A0J0XHR4_9TREE|nr:NAD(P)-binding protein [Cutaneotrichosporon oleaginosum]KLT40646.1 NAD(P)-binding protein [Cutaneotrichosporon oleaginosum]TXT12456.1 hypothetical protein COLE_02866 [Cutaneotrichosporon oleaginosum]
MSVPRLLVVGGNGYLGSAVCKAAVAKGWDVASMSSSGKPYTTPAGHTPKWVDAVQWHRASAFEPDTYRDLIANKSAVVHTMGILFEDSEYKNAIARGDILGLLGSVARSATGSGPASNPLKTGKEARMTYEAMNRDSALTVLDTMLAAPSPPAPAERSFVYISASGKVAFVPDRYVDTKREAELGIMGRCAANGHVRPVIMRPGLMYNAHVRPVSTIPAFALSITAGLQDRLQLPKPASPDSALGKVADSLSTHPLHVDHVADAIVRAISTHEEGIIDVETMREWAGFNVVRPKAEARS